LLGWRGIRAALPKFINAEEKINELVNDLFDASVKK
jgi:hypothetical protein